MFSFYEKLTDSQVVKFRAFYETGRFITAFTNALGNCPCPEPDQSSPCPHPTSRSISILSSHLHLGLPSDLFSSGFFTKALCATHLSPIHATYPAHLIILDLIIRIIFGEEYRSLSFPLCSLLHSSVTLCILGQNILFSTLFSNTLSLRPLSLGATVFHTHTEQLN
jgi:hypothetical protein